MLAPPARSLPQPGHLYDVAVVGAGLAGCELAYRLATAGLDVLLVSQALDHLGNLYAPTLAGAAFPPGSLYAETAERIAPAQDGWPFHRALKARLEETSGVHLLQSCVTAFREEGGVVTLSTWEGPPLRATRAVLAVGAFLKARLMLGDGLEDAGRLSEVAYDFLADDLAAWGLWLRPAERRTRPGPDDTGHDPAGHTSAGHTSADYEVRFLTVPAAEQDGFSLRRCDAVYALGQMTARADGQEHSYASVLQDAARLAAELIAAHSFGAEVAPAPPVTP